MDLRKAVKMTVEHYIELLQLARNRENWSADLFKQYQEACIQFTPCIFNELRKILPKEEYRAFDLEYCEYLRPGTKERAKDIEELHRKEEMEKWKQKSKADLHRMSDEQLLILLNQFRKNNLV
jgi:hypothetical protein